MVDVMELQSCLMGWSAGLQLDPFRLARSDSIRDNRRRKTSLGAQGDVGGLGGWISRHGCHIRLTSEKLTFFLLF